MVDTFWTMQFWRAHGSALWLPMLDALNTAVEEYIETQGGGDGVFSTPMDGVVLMRSSKELMPYHMTYNPALCVVVQGAKQVTLGEQVLNYSAGMALVVSVAVPAFGRVTRATASEPYLGITIEFDIDLMREVMEHLEVSPTPTDSRVGLFVDQLSNSLQECLVRLLRLPLIPHAVSVLYPSIMKEIYFWLLTGPNAGEICKIALTDSHTHRISNAIRMLRQNFSQTVRVEELANVARMSMSSFHYYFKTLTSMTPLQYQKQLRLLEARRLMVVQGASVTNAAFQVGYESSSQFSREYARMFGVPPKRDSVTKRASGVAA